MKTTLLVLVALLALLASVAMAGPPTNSSLTTATLTTTWSAPFAAAPSDVQGNTEGRTEEGSAVVSRPEGSTEVAALSTACDEEGRTESHTEGWVLAAPSAPFVRAHEGAVLVANTTQHRIVGMGTVANTVELTLETTLKSSVEQYGAAPPEGVVASNLSWAVGFVRVC